MRRNLWIPDILFQDALTVDISAQSFRLRPGGYFYWSQHLILTVVQPSFDYRLYPLDYQIIEILYYSNAYPKTYLNQSFVSPPVTYIQDGEVRHFTLNPMWGHDLGDYTATIIPQDRSSYAWGYKQTRVFDYASIKIRVKRLSDGVMIRLTLPIVVLVTLGSLTFWAAQEDRVGSTMTILPRRFSVIHSCHREYPSIRVSHEI